MAKQWSAEWKSSKNPSKQRKYRENAEYHHRKKLLNAHLDDDLQDKVGTGSLPLREGDKVEVMRGDFRGSTGEVEEVDAEEQKIYVNGVERETVGGSETSIALRPSNLKITALELEDDRRLEKYEVSEEDREEIQVE
ncbi:MAG: 50S ribosomal protein L24, partial [Candidatus Nanohaloarchaea archaeon]|nr:50S ribosomal protein L24 [Candidatus Nanohaloarchaea archaeon]